MARYAVIFAMLACDIARPPDCRTHCGMSVYYVDSLECLKLNTFEAEAIAEFNKLYPELCPRLSHVALRVWQVDGGKWTAPTGQTVAGLTYCDLGNVEVAGTNWANNAYFHELAHVAQCPMQDYQHQTWTDAGIWSSIDVLQSRLSAHVPNNLGATFP